MTTTEHSPTAAGSGASATQVFRATHSVADAAAWRTEIGWPIFETGGETR